MDARLRVVCINLDERPDRWANMERRLAGLSQTCSVSRMSARTPETITRDALSYLSRRQNACAQSHYDAWKAFAEDSQEDALLLLLEDDVLFKRGWYEELEQFVQRLDVEEPTKHVFFLNASEDGPRELYRCRDQYLTGATLYTRRGVAWLLSEFASCLAASDQMTKALQDHSPCFCSFPWLAIQDGSLSTIQGGMPTADQAKVWRLLATAGLGEEYTPAARPP